MPRTGLVVCNQGFHLDNVHFPLDNYKKGVILVAISNKISWCSKVNAFEEDNTVRLQIAAHVGPRENVESNFREACLNKICTWPRSFSLGDDVC